MLRCVANGLPNKLIARKLGISEKTVKAHLTRIYQQIGVTDRTRPRSGPASAAWPDAAAGASS